MSGSGGTFVSYQGLVAQRAVFRRSRGFGADWSFVDVPARAFKDPSFVLKLPQVGDGPDLPASNGPEDSETDVTNGTTVLVDEELPSELDHSGTLTMVDVDETGKVFRIDACLYVARLETVLESFEVAQKIQSDGSTKQEADVLAKAMVRITLVDARYFWVRGVLSKWDFNKQIKPTNDPLSTVDRTALGNASLKGGTPWTRAQVAEYVVSCLWGAPKLANVPASWKTAYNADGGSFTISWEPFGSAINALRDLCAEAGVEEPILRLDGQVEIREAGDGLIAPCKNVNGIPAGENVDGPAVAAAELQIQNGDVDKSLVRELIAKWNWSPMDGFRLWKDGTGQAVVREPAYPDDVVIVVGKPIVASVAVDDWEPVLLVSSDDTKFLPGTDPARPTSVLPLTDDSVRRLTTAAPAGHQVTDKDGNFEFQNSPYGIEWLKVWILAPEEFQSQPDVPPNILRIFKEQAWRYYRLPGVETKDGLPGPNAALLPMLDRAEVTAGKRMAPTIERFGYGVRHKEASVDAAAKDLNELNRQLGDLRYSIQRATGRWDIFAIDKEQSLTQWLPGLSYQSSKVHLPAVIFVRLSKTLGREFKNEGVLGPMLEGQLAVARTIERIRTEATNESFAAEYEKLLRAANDLYEKQNGYPTNAALDLAKVCLEAEKNWQGFVNRARTESVHSGSSIFKILRESGKGPEIAAKAAELDLKITAGLQIRTTRRALKTAGEIGLADYNAGATYYANLPRLIDGQAQVIDDKAGIVKTSALAGHLSGYDGQPTPFDRRPFIPRPVRVTFGVETAGPQTAQLIPMDASKPAIGATGTGTGGPPLTKDQAAEADKRLNEASKTAEKDNPTRTTELDKEILAIYEEKVKKEKALYLQNPPDYESKWRDIQQDYQNKVDDVNARIFASAKSPAVGTVADQSRLGIAGGQNVPIKVKLSATESTPFWQAWRAHARDPKTGIVDLRQVNDGNEPFNVDRGPTKQDRYNAVVVRRNFEALVSLGRTEPDDLQTLTRQTKEVALQMFRRQELHLGGKHTFGHPWSVNCDGRVASVEVRTMEWEGVPCGHFTLVTEGSTAFAARPQPHAGTTGERAGSRGK